jgi:hypothetical protein
VIAIVPLGYVFYKYFRPFPPYPLNVYLEIFLGICVVSLAGYVWLRTSGHPILDRIGRLAVTVAGKDAVGEELEASAGPGGS